MFIIAAAVIVDQIFGDPPNEWHPVAWMGTLIARWRKIAITEDNMTALVSGGVIAWGGAAAVWMIGWMVTQLPSPIRQFLELALLKSTFSLSGLVNAAVDVEQALTEGDLDQARHWLGWHLVSRDTSQLNSSQISAATIESLAENLSDGVIAPLFYYQLGGLPAALTYRYLNTCDAMLGYRDAEREWLGKIPARTDDLLNIVPARITAIGVLAAPIFEPPERHYHLQHAVQVYQRDKYTTDSPNAGHPMSAMAGALGIELAKEGQYQLGHGSRKPVVGDIRRAITLIFGAAAISTVIIQIWPSRRKR